jgi:phage-related minor tail protein
MATASDRYWDLVREQLAEERARKNSIEQRGIAVITSSGTLVTLLFGLTALATKAQNYQLPPIAAFALAVAAVLFVLAALVGIAVNWAYYYIEVEPDGLRGLLDENWAGDEAEAAKVVATAWTDIIENARINNARKGKLLRAAMLLEASALSALIGAVAVVLGIL